MPVVERPDFGSAAAAGVDGEGVRGGRVGAVERESGETVGEGGGELLPCDELILDVMSGELFKRGRERGRCAAGLFADAAGEPGGRRSDGFAFRMGMVGPREGLARVRHRWAVLCNLFGFGIACRQGID